MLFLERKLLSDFKEENKEDALRSYRELISQGLIDPSLNLSTTRNFKNYLISLNSSLYEATYPKPVCKKRLYLIRLKFIEAIENSQSIQGLSRLGEDIISSYLDSLNTCCLKANPIISNALIYIDQNLDDQLSLSSVAKNINVSQNYLSSLFSDNLGTNFSKLVKERRINRAKSLLETTDQTLFEIALSCGFNSQSYFSYSFKELEGLTATDYRKQINPLPI